MFVFQTFKSMVELQLNLKIKSVQSDWGGEYRPFSTLLASFGLSHRLTCPHTHHQNGVVERKHRHIIDLGLTLLHHASLPLQLWDYAFTTFVYLINRLPIASLKFATPFVTLFKKEPDYHFLKNFGCACFPLLRPYHTHKLNFHSQECLFLGYSSSHKGYKCLSSGKVYISKDVLFNELRFPYFDLFPTSTSSVTNLDSYFSLNPNLSPPSVSSISQTSQLSNTASVPPGFSPLSTQSSGNTESVSQNSTSTVFAFVQPVNSESTTLASSSSESIFVPNSVPVNTHPMQTRSKSGIHNHRLHSSLFLTHFKPKTVKQALANAD